MTIFFFLYYWINGSIGACPFVQDNSSDGVDERVGYGFGLDSMNRRLWMEMEMDMDLGNVNCRLWR